MQDKDKIKVTYSMDIASILFIVFVVLKLAEVGPIANWSWWWVTAPLWIPVAAAIITAIIVIIIAKIWEMFNN